jgi:uncharacterized SAM-binding protein YcdF (DUF218 family)
MSGNTFSVPKRPWGVKGVRLRRALAVLLGLLLVVTLFPWGMRGVARWLVVADPLVKARAIVVLSGHFPWRAMEAAFLYRDGWAPEVWLTRPRRPSEDAALARLGLALIGEETYSIEVMKKLGVPAAAVRVLSPGAQNTAQEVELVAGELRATGGARVILVTSKPHSRRVRATWRALVRGSPEAMVRYARDDPFEPERWWHNTEDALAVSREVFALMNVWAGFPVRPDR